MFAMQNMNTVMDPHASCQDIQRCQICGDGIAELFCVSCDTRLCRRCLGFHLAEDPEKHNIVKNVDKYTTLVFPVCAMHSQDQCKNYCQQCHLAVCSSCVSSNSHERHKLHKIVDIFKKKKEIIKNDLDEFEQDILPSYEEIVKQVEINREKLKETFEGVLNDIEKQREIWHQEIDLIVNTLKEDVYAMRETQMRAQSVHFNKLQELLVDVKQSIQRNKDLLESLEISKSLSYESINSTLRRLPPKLEISVPRFIPKSIEGELKSEKIGVIVGFCISKQEEGYQLKSQSGVVSRGNRNEKENEEKILKKLLNELQIMTTIETELKGPKIVACTSYRNLWVSSDEGPIQLLNCGASVNDSYLSFGTIYLPEKAVFTGKGRKAIAANKRGDLLFGTTFSNTISIFRDNKVDELVNLNSWSLLSLCITADDELLVCMTDAKGYACRVVRFEGSDERQIIQYDSEGKRLFTPLKGEKFVKENHNGDICVADYDGRAVVVTDITGTLRFRYQSKYRPTGIAIDTQAQLIVPYTCMHDVKIHIIDRNGRFLRFFNIIQSSNDEVGLDIDSEDNLYFAYTNGIVKIIQYMK